MDIFDTFWNIEQDRKLNQLRRKFGKIAMDLEFDGPIPMKIQELAEENHQLKFRLGVLIRLLISKGLITAEEYTSFFDRFAKWEEAEP
jgi:hypothetical protein